MPSAEAVEMVLATVPGVADAEVRSGGESQGTLKIRVADGFDPRSVAEEVSAALRERFSIVVPAEALLHEPRQGPPLEEAPATPVSGLGDTVVLYDASRTRQPEVEAVGVTLPGWDAVLVRAQESAASGARGTALAPAPRAGPNPEVVPGPGLAAVPRPLEVVADPDPLVEAALALGSLPARADAGVIRVVDAGIDGAGTERRAVVVVTGLGDDGERMGIGAALVGSGTDAEAVATATLAAVRDLG